MVKVQVELSKKADAVASYRKAMNRMETKADAINSLLEEKWEALK